MAHEHEEELDELLQQAVQQLIDTPNVNDRPDDLDAVVLKEVLRADRSSSVGISPRDLQRKPMKLFVKYSLAASLLAAVVGAAGWLALSGDNNSVHAAVAERISQLQSIVCRVQWCEESSLVNFIASDGERMVYLAPSSYRIEMSSGAVLVFNTEANKAINLNPLTKEALIMSGPMATSMKGLASPVSLIDAIRTLFRVDGVNQELIEDLGTREIGGVQAKGFRASINGEVVEAWIDPRMLLPIEVRVRLAIPAHLSGLANEPVTMWHIMSEFEYDVAVDRSLMSVEVPAGFKAIQMPDLSVVNNATKPSLTDLIDLLRICAEHNESKFPVSLSMNDTPGTCMEIMKRFASAREQMFRTGTEAEKQAVMDAVVEYGAAMGRATAFLLSLGKKHDLRYFGNGVKLGMADRPLLWYSPNRDSHYQVVYADLSVKQFTASTLPKPPTPLESAVKQRTVIRRTSPQLVLPKLAVKNFDALQRIRRSGKQSEVRFIELWRMPEFMENGMSPESTHKTDAESARLEFLKEFSNLEGLRVDHLFLTENDLKLIGERTGLKKLSLSGIQVLESPRGKHRLRGTELRHLNKLTNLEVLDLSQSQFAGGLQHLHELPKLHTLILSSFEHLNDASVAELKELPYLQTLVLAPVYFNNPETTVTDAGLASLKELPSLKTLYVGYHGEWTMPVKKLQALLPEVNVQSGFQVQEVFDDRGVPPQPVTVREE